MPLTGVLLGAGASYDVGMPLAMELTDELKRWLTPDKLMELNRVWRARGLGYHDDAIATLAGNLAAAGMSYEHIMGNLEVHWFRTSDHAYHGLLGFLSEIIYALLQARHVRNIDLIERRVRYLDGFETLVAQNNPLWVFSLNHDLIVECFAAHSGTPLKAGYSEENVYLPRYDATGAHIGDLKACVLRREQIDVGQTDFFALGERGINLLKIHGSLDEFAFNDGKDLLKLIATENTVRGVITALQIANEQVRYVDPRFPGGQAATANEIIYKDAGGEMQFLRRTPLAGMFKFQNQSGQNVPNELLTQFDSYLNYVTALVCIGYGFGDHHVNQIVRNWLEVRSDRRLTIVDPAIGPVPGIFLHLYPQINLVPLGVTEYLDDLGGVRRSEEQETERRLAAWMRINQDEAGAELQKYYSKRIAELTERIAQWVKTLPFRDGDVDLEAMGVTEDEFKEMFGEQVNIPSAHDVLEDFLRRATE